MLRRPRKFLLFLAITLAAIGEGLWLARKPARRRALWAQKWGAYYCRLFGVAITVKGEIPSQGLVVANHLGYLDIPVLAKIMPCAFVSKSEVRSWPLLGSLAKLANTVFVDRNNAKNLTLTAKRMKQHLQHDIPLVLFPEGTSSAGRVVLPFRPSLLQPVCDLSVPLRAAHIAYRLEDGDAGEEVCYWGDMTLLPHLWNLLGKKSLHAEISFSNPPVVSSDRKQLAAQLHAEVVSLGSPSARDVTLGQHLEAALY